MSFREKTVCFEYLEDLVPEVTLPEEKVSISPRGVANGTPSLNRCLEVRL